MSEFRYPGIPKGFLIEEGRTYESRSRSKIIFKRIKEIKRNNTIFVSLDWTDK